MDQRVGGSTRNGVRDRAHDGFFRVAAATPAIRVADVEANAAAALAHIRAAARQGAGALALPELCLTGYTCQDLFLDRTLIDAAERSLRDILAQTRDLPLLFTIGLPVAHGSALYNCCAVCCAGRLLGLSAKRNLPNHGEFYEARWFSPAPADAVLSVRLAGQSAPLGWGLVFCCSDDGMDEVAIGVEICEDLWVADPPSVEMALARGAAVVLNASASDEIIGKADYRSSLVSAQSARLFCAYVYADAGEGESTTDLVFAGENLIAENGRTIAETDLFTTDMASADIDLDRLCAERRRSSTWTARVAEGSDARSVPFSFTGSARALASDSRAPAEALMRSGLTTSRIFPRLPFVPADTDDLAARCELILGLQAAGLKTRLSHTHAERIVIGVSGGLDSTLALLVCARAFDDLGLARAGIVAVSMPGFGTTGRTKGNAERLARSLDATFREIPIDAAVRQHFRDIGHDARLTDVTYENSQARERTQILMDLANQLGALVIGTGDLSELALGWATYNGDHMSMYGVNASVPKTLVRHLVGYVAEASAGEIADTLSDILDTPVSPELLPPEPDGAIAQRTEELVGPYELHDYFLYYLLRFGLSPGRIFRTACRSFDGTYDPSTILSWLRVFYRRFFSQQFKRSALPDGPKVGSVSLSPRGDWRMPSDASARMWLDEIDRLTETLANEVSIESADSQI
ncbi:NAD+ synthetase [Coriobacterium glomerans PW2]|uniref:Glutamine-dependent NAD(+) synthetase n=1 Tax=Coriobacterium glomerans (strain ATCC 49209 / DSM 20642 / JCM 10262 / PW2) TaxID=700015 RepID=F2N7L6_CORGP|nr:NAD(+) synthase [Coriobacterium glomerans]AEB06832.1 NAD+ synthetase [Coriobacterium glomerans PW2]